MERGDRRLRDVSAGHLKYREKCKKMEVNCSYIVRGSVPVAIRKFRPDVEVRG